MKIARVIGSIWATRKDEKLTGYKLLILEPVDIWEKQKKQEPFVAADMIGAGVGETVLWVGGSSARSAAADMGVPVDATVVAIVDDMEVCEKQEQVTKQ